MALTGPPPKRQEERRRRNTTTESGVSNAVQTVEVFHDDMEDTSLVKAPAPDPNWHPLALMHYEAAKRSAIREFYEPSDWAALFLVCDQITRHLNPQTVVIQNGEMAGQTVEVELPMPGGVLTAILKGLGNLMFTEGERRRLRIEVERQAGSAAAREQIVAPTGDNVIQIRSNRLEGAS